MSHEIARAWWSWRAQLRWPVIAGLLYAVVATAAVAGTVGGPDGPAPIVSVVAVYAALGLVLLLPRPTMGWRVAALLAGALVLAVRHHLDGGAGILPDRLLFDAEGARVLVTVLAVALPLAEATGAWRLGMPRAGHQAPATGSSPRGLDRPS